MQNKEEIKEDTPVTTTTNAGNPLVKPEIPIKTGIFKRYKDMTKKKTTEQNQSRDRHVSDFL